MNISTQEKMIKKCFNKAANTYDMSSQPQQKIGEHLLSYLSASVDHAENIIDLGCGSGLLTEKLAGMYNYKKFYAIDIADQLLRHAHTRLLGLNIHVEEKNFHYFHYPDCSFDLVFSNMALHWSLGMTAVFLSIHRHLAQGGSLAFTVPLENTFMELNSRATHSFYTQADITALLVQAGFIISDCSSQRFVFYYGSLLDALHSIKETGANYHAQHSSSLRGKLFLNTLYTAKKIDEKFPLTYEIGFFIARKI